MSHEQVTFTLDGQDGRMPPRALMVALRTTVTMLDGIVYQTEGEEHPGTAWDVEHMVRKHNAQVTISGDAPSDTGDILVSGIKTLNEKAVKPPYFNFKMLGSAKTFTTLLNRGIRTLALVNGHAEVAPTLHVAANVDALIGERFFDADTTLEGQLQVIDVRGKLRLTIREESYGRDVRCICSNDLFEKARQYLNQRVSVTGKVKYNKQTGDPVSLEALDILPIGAGEDVGFADLPRIDITNGKPAHEYIRRLRDA